MTKTIEQQLERQAVLGLLVEGIVHEIVNSFNSILMNAELGTLYVAQSADESENLTEVLRTIGGETERGGALGRQLLDFARSADYAPQAADHLDRVIALAVKLLGSRIRQNEVGLSVQKNETLPELRLNSMAVTLVVASLIERLITAGARRIEVFSSSQSEGIVLSLNVIEPSAVSLADDYYTQLMLNFARRVLGAHKGELRISDTGLQLYFPMSGIGC